MKTIYLAGYGGEFNYRETCLEKWGDKFNFIDPMKASEEIFQRHGWNHTIEEVIKNNLAMPLEIRVDVVNNDKQCISVSDILLVYLKRKTFGTIMEIMFAYMKEKPIHVINPGMTFLSDVWLSVHATMLWPNLDQCMNYLINEDKKRND